MKKENDHLAAAGRPSFFDAQSWFAFLLRTDVRGPADPESEDTQRRFLTWWLTIGRREYRAGPASPELRQFAWQAVPFAKAGRPGMTMPRILASQLELREDVCAAVDIGAPGGLYRAFGWLLLSGIAEYALEEFVDDALRAWLSAPEAAAATAVPIPRLLYFVHCFRRDLQDRFNLATAAGCTGLGDWARGDPDARNLALFLIAPAPQKVRSVDAGKPEPLAPGCNLIGYAFGELGIGEDVRMMSAACEAAHLPFAIGDFSEGLESRAADRSVAHRVGIKAFSTSIFCLTGFDTARYYLEKGDALFRDRFVIGYWPWELPHWPRLWHSAFDLVDEIWVSSRYTQQAFQATAPVPVLHMPMAVQLPAAPPVRRGDFDLPDGRFHFLFVFDANSSLARKNPMAAIAAFRMAFPQGDEPVGLVLKAMNRRTDSPLLLQLELEVAEDPRITLLWETMDKPRVIALMACCDAYLSLHRAEGFGRTIAEAMLLGKPVVATGWSGSDELVTSATALPVSGRLVPVGSDEYPWAQGQVWADPDVGHAAACLRRLVEDTGLYRQLAEAGRQHVQRHHAPAVVAARYSQRLLELGLR